MTAKRNDRKERWLQENNDCNKAMTAKNRPLQRAVLEGSLKSSTKASFSHLQLADFEGSLARKLPLHNFNLQILKETRTKASFSHLQLADFEGRVARESFPLHNFNLQVLKRKSRRFWRTRARKLSAQLQLAGFQSRTQARSGGQNAPHHRPEPCQPIVAQIPVFSYYLIPNSISFSITYSTTYSYYLIPITCVFAVKVGLLSPCVQKHREKKIIFSSLANAWAPFTWENTGNRN